MGKKLITVDEEALAEASEMLGTVGVQETVTAALAELSGLYLRLKASEERRAARDGGDVASSVSENYQ